MPKEVRKPGGQGKEPQPPTTPETSDDLTVFEEIMKAMPGIVKRIEEKQIFPPAPDQTQEPGSLPKDKSIPQE